MGGTSLGDLDVLARRRLVGDEPLAVVLDWKLKCPRAVQVVARRRVDQSQHIRRSVVEIPVAQHDAPVNHVLVEQQHVARAEVVLDPMNVKQLLHDGVVQKGHPQREIVLHARPLPRLFLSGLENLAHDHVG